MTADLVICDARWDPTTRLGCLAVVGAVGEHTKIRECSGSTVAEILAVLLALEVAQQSAAVAITIRSDIEVLACRGPGEAGRLAAEVRDRLAGSPGWQLEWVGRAHTQLAHDLAARVWRAHVQPSTCPPKAVSRPRRPHPEAARLECTNCAAKVRWAMRDARGREVCPICEKPNLRPLPDSAGHWPAPRKRARRERF